MLFPPSSPDHSLVAMRDRAQAVEILSRNGRRPALPLCKLCILQGTSRCPHVRMKHLGCRSFKLNETDIPALERTVYGALVAC